ncbi:MAG: pilus assembly protein [Deltaproteobacteria bacterium]|nr:pilus assembly protein [Deltaproteobacteria bacterium]
MTPHTRIALSATGFAALSLGLASWSGGTTWGRESVALLGSGMATAYDAATPLVQPLYNADIMLFGLMAAAALVAGGKMAWVLAKATAGFFLSARARRSLSLGTRGQAMTEFAISFPIVLITTLILMQLALMYQAKNVVTYAAFSAARAAIVYIPSEVGGEPKHSINVDGGDKYDKVNQAAAMACVPISPRASVVLDGLPFVGDIISSAFSTFSQMMSGLGIAGEYVDSALQRYAYSTFATSAALYKADESGGTEVSGTATWDWPTESDVGVIVSHRFYLAIPLVNRFIGDDWSLLSLPPFFSLNLPGQYTEIRAHAVLPLEGETGDPPISGFWDM